MNNISETWYAVVNPNAGSGKTLAQWRHAESILYSKGIPYRFTIPETLSDSKIKIASACKEGYRHFIAVGGDGTVHNLLCSIAEFVEKASEEPGAEVHLTDFYLAVLPIGSGNDWLRSHRIPSDCEKIIELISRNSFGRQDVVKVEILEPETGKIANVAYMANIGGYCFDANVCDVVNFQKTNGVTGKLLYFNAVKNKAKEQKAYKTRIVCDGQTIFDDLLYSMSIGNGKYSGGGLCQTPSAVMDDGMLDIMIAPKFPIIKLVTSLHKVLEKRMEDIDFLQFARARDIRIEPYGQGQLVEVDGDIVGRAPAHLFILDEQINVLDQN